MSILEEAKSNCSEAELPALSLKLDNIAAEFNMIRSMHPEVEVQIHPQTETPVSGEVSPRDEMNVEQPAQPAQPAAMPTATAAMPTGMTANNSLMETVNQTCNEVVSYVRA